MINSYKIIVSNSAINELKVRLSHTRWPDKERVDDWSQGIPLHYVQEVVDYWLHNYDHHRLAKRLNQWSNFCTEINGVDIHFIHVRSSSIGAKPLILTHGWPGSVIEFLKVIEPLTEPQAFGGCVSDAFHLVIPSLSGYGFSGRPEVNGWGIEKIADCWAELKKRLGYPRYLAQGGDWGSLVTAALARQDIAHCRGIHLNMVAVPPDKDSLDLTDQEKAALVSLQFYQDWDSGYSKIQATRPQTLGFALADSPGGQAAWILEKFFAWTDCGGHPENVLSRDELLDNIMVYWLNGAGASSARLYWHSFGRIDSNTHSVSQPMGASIFPKEIIRTSRCVAERVYTNIVHWNELDRGGRFAAFECPMVFAEEIRNCFRMVT